jgi:hypothetical protein
MSVDLIFDHVGIPTDEQQPDENWVESTRVWVTNPHTNKYHVEYLRFEPDTPVAWECANLPHVAYRVKAEDFPTLLQNAEILIEPFDVDDNLSIAYVKLNGMPVEYMVYKDPELWFGKKNSAS